jgi:hypothetical protein
VLITVFHVAYCLSRGGFKGLSQLITIFGATAPSGPGPPQIRGIYSTPDAPQSVVLLWTSDQLVAETST